MPYQFQRYAAPIHYFAHWTGGFTDDEVEKITFLEDLQNFEKGRVGDPNSSDVSDQIRNSEVSWIYPDTNSSWVFDRLGSIIPTVNRDHFMLDIDGIETLQYTKYGIDQHYTWHWDIENGWQNYIRKISAVVMLSGPDEYEGGEFEICNTGNFEDTLSIKPNKGDIIFFSSWMPHRVKPVTSGERKTLVAWVMGKREC